MGRPRTTLVALVLALLIAACGADQPEAVDDWNDRLDDPEPSPESSFPSRWRGRTARSRSTRTPDADRVALAERDRGPVRDRRRRPGRRGGRPVELPARGADDRPLRVRAQRRSDRRVRAGPRRVRDRARRSGIVTRRLRDHGAAARRGGHARRRVRADRAARASRPATRRRHRPSSRSSGPRWTRSRPPPSPHRGRPSTTSSTTPSTPSRRRPSSDSSSSARAREHRGRGGPGQRRVPATVGRVHHRDRSRPDLPRGHEVLRTVGRDRRRAAGLGPDRGGHRRRGRAARRRRRLALGSAGRRSPASRSPTLRVGRRGGEAA